MDAWIVLVETCHVISALQNDGSVVFAVNACPTAKLLVILAVDGGVKQRDRGAIGVDVDFVGLAFAVEDAAQSVAILRCVVSGELREVNDARVHGHCNHIIVLMVILVGLNLMYGRTCT